MSAYTFIVGNAKHNRSELDRLQQELQQRHPGYAINVSHEVDATRVRLRFTLSAVPRKGTHETQPDDYELAIVEAASGEQIEGERLIRPPSDAILDYEQGDRL